ncbi:MAG: response regulator transcription factor [Clostridiales bacterium]|nr:response regulator transcription factor [Clostridiales bacterium]
MNILLAEDETSLAKAVSTIFSRNGWKVDAAKDGSQALDKIRAISYDALVLDIMMPKTDGITVLKTIRAEGDLTPVLMLTAKAELDDKVTGLEAGANDYLTKPFQGKELMARIKAMTRAQNFQEHPKLHLGNVSLDRKNLELSTPSGSLRLAYRESRMLEILMTNPQGSIPRAQLLKKIWKGEETDEEAVKVYVSYLKHVNADDS